jgi:hypothetical protein
MPLPRGRVSYAKKVLEPLVPTPQAGPDPEFHYFDPLQRGRKPALNHPVLRGRGIEENEPLQDERIKYAK